MKAWVNGRIIPQEQATVPVLCHSLGRGSAVFEVLDLTSTPRGPAIFRAGDHADRLLRSAEFMHMEMPLSAAELVEAMKQTARAAALSRGGIKVLAYWSQVEIGLMPRTPRVDVAIFCYDFESAFGSSWKDFHKPVSACLSGVRKLKPDAVPVHAKAAGHYINGMLARRQAVSRGYDEAILLDDAGNLAEAPTSSLFVVRDGTVLTSRLDTVLAGITRDSVIQITRDLGLALCETDVPAAALGTIGEAFFTSTHHQVLPIRAIEERALVPCPGPITARIQKAVEDAYEGRDPRYAHWLDYV